MAKKKKPFSVETDVYGLFANWSNRCGELPAFLRFTRTIPARFEAEFGYILHFRGAKGLSVDYRVVHPPFRNSSGDVEPDFTGSLPIRSNDYSVYIGDTLWLPLEDKTGQWRFISKAGGQLCEDMTFFVVSDTNRYRSLIDENANRHIN
ncbi:MAG: DUF3859 domain-containing protein [Fibrobacterota bacterium]